MNRIASFMFAKIIHLQHKNEHLFLFYDHQHDDDRGWKELLLSRFHSIVPRINFISRLLYHRHISITAPAIIIIFNMTFDHDHHDDICQICVQRSQYTYQQDFICKVSFTFCLFLQILFCFLSQIFEIRSVCIDLRVRFAKHTETTFAFMAPLFAFHFASCNWYICILE